MKRILVAFLCGALLFISGCSRTVAPENLNDIRINEVLTCGGETDWIELYNSGEDAVSLYGCYLSNDPKDLGKWQFPEITIEAGAYLTLYADGKTDAGESHLPFRLSASGVSLFLSEHSGTLIAQLEIPAAVSGLSYGLYNDSYTWFASPTPAADNQNGMVLGEETTLISEGLRINEYMSRNKSVLYDENGDYSDWVEIHNFSDRVIDLSGYSLTDARDNAVKWLFPAGTTLQADSYLVVRCSGRNTVTDSGELHTNFKLGAGDSFVGLYTSEGRFCCGITYSPTQQNFSCGYLDGSGYVALRYPTPGYANNSSVVSEVVS